MERKGYVHRSSLQAKRTSAGHTGEFTNLFLRKGYAPAPVGRTKEETERLPTSARPEDAIGIYRSVGRRQKSDEYATFLKKHVAEKGIYDRPAFGKMKNNGLHEPVGNTMAIRTHNIDNDRMGKQDFFACNLLYRPSPYNQREQEDDGSFLCFQQIACSSTPRSDDIQFSDGGNFLHPWVRMHSRMPRSV